MDLPAPVFQPAQSIDPSFLPHPSPFEVQDMMHVDGSFCTANSAQCGCRAELTCRAMQGIYSPNDRLTKAVRAFDGQVNGSGMSRGSAGRAEAQGLRHCLEACSLPVRLAVTMHTPVQNPSRWHQMAACTSSTAAARCCTPPSLGPTAEPQLHAAAVAHIGGGRTLGAHFDREGNLIFCHPPVVRPALKNGSRHAPSCVPIGSPIPKDSFGPWCVPSAL